MTTVMPFDRVVGAYLAEARYEALRLLRAPAFGAPFLLIPIALYLFFAILRPGSGTSTPANAATYLYTAFGVVGIMGPALFGFGLSVALDREQGLLRLKRALPMPPAAYLLAKMATAMMFSALVSLTIAMGAAAVSSAPPPAVAMVGVALVNVAGTLPFCAIGLFIGTCVSGRAAPAVVNLVYLPMIYLSSLFFPLPPSIRVVTVFSPAFHLNQLALGVAGVPSVLGPVMHTAALAGVTILFTGLAVRRLARAA